MALISLRAFRDRRRGETDIEAAPLGLLVVAAVGDPYEVGIGGGTAAPAVGGFVVGPQSRYGSSTLTGEAVGVQVDLPWSAAATIFGPALAELADRAVPLALLPGGTRLIDRLSEGSAVEQVTAVRGWLRDRGRSHRGPSPLAVRALVRIEAGADSVEALAAELGCSRGHLHRSVRAATGQSPSTLMRVVRLHRLVAGRPGRNLADVAADLGYADHAHLCHETRRLAGRTPSQLLGDRVT